MSDAPAGVDEYIARAPETARGHLAQLRDIVRAAAPEATERISYGMPAYDLNGRLAYFAVHTRHVGLYPADRELAEAVGLGDHLAAKSALQFALDRPLPVAAIRAFVERRAAALSAAAARPGS